MASPETSSRQKDYSSRKYSRSPSIDSEEERRRRRRRREREADRGSRSDRRDDRSRGTRDRYEDKERHRRRSRSPTDSDSRRQKDDRDSYRRKRDRSRDRSRDRRRTKDDDKNNVAQPAEKTAVTRRQNGPLPSQAASFQSKRDPSSTALVPAGDEPIKEKEKPNLGQTGVLAAASNTITQADGNAIVLKYHEPPEACKPPARDDWKLFVFKGADIIETIDLSTKSCWLVGRELAVVDLAAEHPSISKQHAAIQFKATEKMNEFGDKVRKVKPYLIDLDSANGTMMNKDPVDKSRYVELMDKDMIQFGHSTREYVLMLAPKT